ncbi:MAG: AAA family ATPase, partial [Planctomycetes bacterium]|nr:AAA family ATPase [Planctomycetota bacterium]
MSQGDRLTENGVALAPRPKTEHAVVGKRSSCAAWEEIFPALSPKDSERFLSLATDQGLLLDDNSPPVPSPTSEEFRALLGRVLTENSAVEPAPFVEAVEPFDTLLDSRQRDAVAQALQTPDLLLIHGLPGTGKARTVVELIRQATHRGKRVLCLGPTPRSVDGILMRLLAQNDCPFVRVLDHAEKAEQNPDSIAERTAKRLQDTRRA